MGLEPRPERAAAPGVPARAAATELLFGVLDRKRPLDQLLEPGGIALYDSLPARDRRLAYAIAVTALRRHGEVDALLGRLIERRPRRAGRLYRVLEVAAAQLLFMDVPDHAAVSIALEQLAADSEAVHFKGLANAVLRRMARERETLLAGLDPRLNAPAWLSERWALAYGEETASRIAAAHLGEPPLDLTVKGDAEGWAAKLGGIVLPTGGVRLIPSGPIDELPGYGDGEWWVQDAAAALPARVLGDVGGKRVADLCAAPGGKTAQLAAAGAEVTAVDISAHRLTRLKQNLARLRLKAETVTADVLAWSPPAPFDAILLDAPCTATGTIRRHPDVPWLKQPGDAAKLARLQAAMLARAATWLKPGGTLVYCTCSLEPEEGEAEVPVAEAAGLRVKPIAAREIGGLAEAITERGFVRTLPFQLAGPDPRLSGLDGFFIARLEKP
ncbi:MAG TPA: transcription antitermination factor NusB [Bauldia sp.]|nr:transcription antitermination factor NusB [Bauldia sp.]